MLRLMMGYARGLVRASTLVRASGSLLLQWLVLLLLPLPVLRPDDQYILRYYAAVKRVLEPALHRVFLLLRPANNVPTRDLLFALPSYSKTKYREFSYPERNMLDNNAPSEAYDVTILYKVLLRVCGLDESNCSVVGSIEYKLKVLKGHRNELSHENIQLTSSGLQSRVAEIKQLCREILEEAGNRSGRLVSGYVREMEDGIDEVLTGGIDLWEPYKQGLQHLRQEQCNVLIRDGKEDVRLLGQKLRILNPCAWLLESVFSHLVVTEVFTELTLEGKGPASMWDLLTLRLPSGQLPDAIIISGSPGSGKTSLLRYLLHDWLTGTFTIRGLDSFDMVLPIETRNVCSNNVCSYVRDELLPNSCRQLHREDVLATLRGVSVLWLVDGYDEATVKTKDLIQELLQKFSGSKVLITTRTECEREVELMLNGLHISAMKLTNIGFSNENKTKFIEKFFCASVQNSVERRDSLARFHNYLDEQNHYTKMIFNIPLFLAMLMVLWLDNQALVSSATTTTRFFEMLINNIINKMVLRKPFKMLNITEKSLRKKVEAFLNKLGRLFWISYFKFTFDDSDYLIVNLEKYCDDIGLPFNEVMSPFFITSEKSTVTGNKREYTIIHRSLQDFLRAKAFCDMMLTRDCDILTTTTELKESSREYYQHHGLLSQNEVQLYFKKGNFTMKKLCDDDEMHYKDYTFPPKYEYESPAGPVQAKLLDSDDNVGARSHCYYFYRMCTADSTLSLMTGYLKSKKALTRIRAEQIVYVTSILPSSLSFWYQIIKESEEDRILLEEISSHLSVFQWDPNPLHAGEVCELVKFVTPQLVLIHMHKAHEEKSDEILKIAKVFQQLPVEIHLDFRPKTFGPENVQLGHHECLNIVLGETSKCCLTTLYWPDSTPCLSLLKKATNLQELWIKVKSIEDLKLLAENTNSMQHLQHLNVTVDSTLYTTDPRRFPSLMNSRWKNATSKSKLGSHKVLLPLPTKSQCLPKLYSYIDVPWGVKSLLLNVHTVHIPSNVDTFARKLQLPSVVECDGGCTVLHSDYSVEKHRSAFRYHKQCIKIIKSVQSVMKLFVDFVETNDKTSWMKLNPCAKYHDTDGTWWCRVSIGVCAAFVFQHRTSLQMHHRFLRCFSSSKLTSPVHLWFSEAQTLNLQWLGAATAQLCPNPERVTLDISLNEVITAHQL